MLRNKDPEQNQGRYPRFDRRGDRPPQEILTTELRQGVLLGIRN
jgi:hypothetical protein